MSSPEAKEIHGFVSSLRPFPACGIPRCSRSYSDGALNPVYRISRTFQRLSATGTVGHATEQLEPAFARRYPGKGEPLPRVGHARLDLGCIPAAATIGTDFDQLDPGARPC